MDNNIDSFDYDIPFGGHSFNHVTDLTYFINSDKTEVSIPIKCQNCYLHENRIGCTQCSRNC